MSISFDKALGIHPQALETRVQRAEVLANNLANADTPGFKARDIDFKKMLAGQQEQQLQMTRTSGNHLPSHTDQAAMNLKYRIPQQASLDGNTVETQHEISEFTKNTLSYQASFQFLNGKFKGLTKAIKGE